MLASASLSWSIGLAFALWVLPRFSLRSCTRFSVRSNKFLGCLSPPLLFSPNIVFPCISLCVIILHLLSLIRERDCVVSFAWIPSLSGISGNEQAHCVARTASRLPFTVHYGVPLADLYFVLDWDFRSWGCSQWPYVRSSSGRSEYFNRVNFKTPRPWFMVFRFPRGYVSLVTRFRSSHIFTGSHFIRMGWDLDPRCDCGAELKSLAHLINECPILSEGRPGFFHFLAERFPGRPPEQTDLGDLIFDPDPVAVRELGRFVRSGDLVILDE